MSEQATSLDTLLDDKAPAQEQSAPPVEQRTDPQTGDKQSEAPPADASGQHEARDDGPLVPRKALEDERRKRQDYERRLEELEKAAKTQQQPQQPQQQRRGISKEELEQLLWTDPAQYTAIVTNYAAQTAAAEARREAEQFALSRELDKSQRRAEKAHGKETVTAALEAVRATNPKLFDTFIREEDDAYEAMMTWYKGTYRAIADPQAYEAELEARILAKHGIVQPGQSQSQPRSRAPVPKSLASTASAQPRDESGKFATSRASLDEILG